MTDVDEFTDLKKSLTQLARLALQGKQRDVDVFVRRLAKRFEQLEPELAEDLSALLRSAPAKPAADSVLRGGAVVERMPVDLDSRLSLARTESPVQLEQEPHWSGEVARKLREVVFERQHEDE